VLRAGDKRLLDRVRAGIAAQAPKADIRRLEAPPVLGAALIGLDELHAPSAARVRLRESLTHRRLVERGSPVRRKG
jgi:hypothetical protein